MIIDLRYPLVIASFYLPGLLLLIGAWILGYTTEEARPFIALAGGLGGLFETLLVAMVLFTDGEPLWFRIGGKDDQAQ